MQLGGRLADISTQPLAAFVPIEAHKQLHGALKVLAAFFLSGLLHEYVLFSAYGTVSGSNMAFFMLHGAVVVIEGVGRRLFPDVAASTPAWVGRIWAVGITVASAPLMLKPFIARGFFCYPVQPGLWHQGVSGAAAVFRDMLHVAAGEN